MRPFWLLGLALATAFGLAMVINSPAAEAYGAECPNVPSDNEVHYIPDPWWVKVCHEPSGPKTFPLYRATTRTTVPWEGLRYEKGEVLNLSANGVARSDDGQVFGTSCWVRAPANGTIWDSGVGSTVNPQSWHLPYWNYCQNVGVAPSPPPPPPPPCCPPPQPSGCIAGEEHWVPMWGTTWYPGRPSSGLVEVHVWWPDYTLERKLLLESWQRPGFINGGGSAWSWPVGCEQQARSAFQNNATWMPTVTLDQLRSESRVR